MNCLFVLLGFTKRVNGEFTIEFILKKYIFCLFFVVCGIYHVIVSFNLDSEQYIHLTKILDKQK